jgi:MoaA/NifB/PqqE/SkfB family radical SAM enzyme
MPISHVLLFLTYRCNLRCDFCISFNSYWQPEPALLLPSAVSPTLSLGSPRAIKEMSTADIVNRVIPQCAKNGVKVIALSGGEVLVRQDAIAIFQALGNSNMRWCFDSNLMLCTEEISEAVIKSRCDAVFVSLDGTREVHNKLRCSPKAHEKTVNGLRRLVAARRASGDSSTSVIINCVLQPGNESEPPKMVETALEHGADELTFQLLSERKYRHPFDAKAAAESLHHARVLADTYNLRTAVYPIVNPDLEDLVSWFSMTSSEGFFDRCTYIHHNLRIDPEGNVIPCLEYKLGNILEQELADIWTGSPYRAFRKHVAHNGGFQACLRCCNMTLDRAKRAQVELRPDAPLDAAVAS